MPRLTMVEAIVQGLCEEFDRDQNVFFMGQDIGPLGGPLQSFKGVWEKYGNTGRVIDAPISEEVITAACFGAALRGKRPVFELMFSEFTTLAMGPFASDAGIYYKTDGILRAPVVMRTKFGVSPHRGHQEDFTSLFSHLPGLKVVVPTTPYDAKGLIKSAVRDDNPVIFCEHMSLMHGRREEIPETEYLVPIGAAEIKRQGRDLTIIAAGLMVKRALSAADELADRGIEAEVVDLRTVLPLDTELILKSVAKTGRALIVHEAWRTGGFGAEVAAVLAEKAFDRLIAPVMRLAPPHLPVPYSLTLENAFIPGEAAIVDAATRLAGTTAVRASARSG